MTISLDSATRCIVLLGLSAVAGCASSGAGEPVREVRLAEFARADVPPPQAEPSSSAIALGSGDSQAMEVLAMPEAEVETVELIEPGEVIVVDSLVGQVNGRPIFAATFFEPIEDQLIASAARARTARLFAPEAVEIVSRHLREVVLDELFLAEAESNLSAEQKQGIRYWLKDLRENIVSSKGGGSQAVAEQRLQEQEAMSVDEYVRSIKEQALTRQLWQQEIDKHVTVSWHDMEREYQRRYDEFNPPATVTISRIRLRTEDETMKIETVKTLLAAGTDFAEVATAAGMSDGGLWTELEIGAGGLAEAEISEQVRPHIAHLKAGETSEPFELGRPPRNATWWLHITAVNRPEGLSIYDPGVQSQLEQDLRSRRQQEERIRFINTLMAGGIYDEINEMGERLVAIAVARYGP